MTGAFVGRDGHEVDALVTDRYLDALLAAHARGADRGPSPSSPDDPIRRTADSLARDLPRLHPSFLFEEALAARLAEVAARMRSQIAVRGPGRLVAFREVGSTDPVGDGSEALPGHRRPLLIGGALTSAAISLAGAAYVAWRLNRPPGDPMARAARAIARSRLV
jgi:hypothetical protein